MRIELKLFAFFITSCLSMTSSFAEVAGCRNFDPKCTEIPKDIKLKIDQCQIQRKAEGCDSLIKETPDLASQFSKCSPQEICDKDLFKINEIQGCLKGTWDLAKDTVMFPIELADAAWTAASKSIQAKNEFIKVCNTNLSCKKSLIKDIPKYEKYTDEQISKLSAAFLQVEKQNWDYISSTYARQSAAPKKTIQNEDIIRTNTNIADSHSGLWEMGVSWIKNQGVKLSCYTPAAQSELVCYGVLSVVAPGSAAKYLSKAPKVAKTLGAKPTASLKKGALSSYVEKEFTTVKQNETWIAFAQSTRPKGKVFFDVENAAMKKLNDTTKDKNLVTALTNKHKDFVLEEVMALQKKYPGLEIHPYSDFKSLRFAFSGNIPKGLEKDLDEAFKKANKAFFEQSDVAEVTSKVGDKNWFHAGMGETADQANMAARYSRASSEVGSVQKWGTPYVTENVGTSYKASELWRTELQQKFGNTPLMEPVAGTNKRILNREVFDIIKKNSDDEVARGTLKARFGTKVTDSEIKQMREYSLLVDEFQPGIHVAKREIANFTNSPHGGLSADFAGMGSYNFSSTAEALARSKNMDDVLMYSREGEREVTKLFNQRKDEFKSSIERVLSKKTGFESICSGDDCVVLPKKPLDPSTKSELINELAQSSSPSSLRLAFVPDKVKVADDRIKLATHGESIEKEMRKYLEGEIPAAKSRNLIFGIDMQTTQIGAGDVKLILGNKSSTQISTEERNRISNAFKKAVEKINTESSKEPRNYRPNP
jgi:hypothetical protein